LRELNENNNKTKSVLSSIYQIESRKKLNDTMPIFIKGFSWDLKIIQVKPSNTIFQLKEIIEHAT